MPRLTALRGRRVEGGLKIAQPFKAGLAAAENAKSREGRKK
jgi:hypothetical protein